MEVAEIQRRALTRYSLQWVPDTGTPVMVGERIGKGELIDRLWHIHPQRWPNYVVTTYADSFGGSQVISADQWWPAHYLAPHNVSAGEVVMSRRKATPVYQVVKALKHVVWLQPYDLTTQTAYGAVQRGVSYDIIARL